VLKILRRALEGWDALEPDLAEAAGPGMALPEHARSSSRSATQAVVDALVDIVGARSGNGAGIGHDHSQLSVRPKDEGELGFRDYPVSSAECTMMCRIPFVFMCSGWQYP
jgi:hypothetical protein